MIDFNYDRAVMVLYPRGCGGKFIINCLGLSNDVLLQNFVLASEQLRGNLSSVDKLNYYESRFNLIKHTKIWDDLGLGCKPFFREDQFDAERNPVSTKKMLKEAMHQHKYFFIVAHNAEEEHSIMNRWHDAKIIKVSNCLEIFQNSSSDGNFLIDKFEYKYHHWNAKWTTNVSDVLFHMQELYNNYNIRDFNAPLIEKYWLMWIETCMNIGRFNEVK